MQRKSIDFFLIKKSINLIDCQPDFLIIYQLGFQNFSIFFLVCYVFEQHSFGLRFISLVNLVCVVEREKIDCYLDNINSSRL